MKKRKSPVVLATVLVIMVVSVGIFYGPKKTVDPEHPEQPQGQTPPPETQERPKMSASDVSRVAAGTMKTGGGSPKAIPSRPGMPGGEGDGSPSIAMPKANNYKPKPNDSSTSTQWYTDQTNK